MLFGNLKNLLHLELHYNQLTTLPDSFGNLENLQKLELGGNKGKVKIPNTLDRPGLKIDGDYEFVDPKIQEEEEENTSMKID